MRRTVLLGLLIALFFPAYAQPELPARFARLYSLSDIGERGYVAIGATEDGGHYLMRQVLSTQVAGKLTVTPAGQALENYTLTQEDNVWCIERYGTGWSLSGKRGYLAPDGQNGFRWSERPVAWTLVETGHGTFALVAAETPDYKVGVRSQNGTHYFGRYRNEDDRTQLHLYRFEARQAQPPTNNSRVALAVLTEGEFYCLNSDLASLTDAGNYRLANDTLSPEGCFAQWTVRYADADYFCLVDDCGQALAVDSGRLVLLDDTGSQSALWQVENGLIQTAGRDVPSLILGTKTVDGACVPYLYTPDELLVADIPTFAFYGIGSPPSFQTDEHGALFLLGAWSTFALSALSLQGITTVDLSRISLPRAGLTLHPDGANTLIYIRDDETEYVGSQPLSLIAVGNGENVALTPISLTDKDPFYVLYPFRAAHGVTYTRTAIADGGWETLCIPFDVKTLPGDFAFEEVRGISGMQLRCEQVTAIEANRPVIFTCANTTTGDSPVELSLSAENVWVTAESDVVEMPLRPNYTHFTVGERAGSCYLLNKTGTTFVLADATSSLPPFRAYLITSAVAARFRLLHDTPTCLRSVGIGTESREVYSLDGKLLTPNSNRHKQVIIVNGKKIIR